MDISKLVFVNAVGDGEKTACLMSARSLLDGRPFGDDHPSGVLQKIGIRINDGNWWTDDVERTTVLLLLAMDERLCASKCNVTKEAELERAKMCAQWALSFATPMALDCAADAFRTRWPESAATLSGHADKLRREPTRKNVLVAKKDAASAYADAAAAAAYAANAAADAAAAAAAAADSATAYATYSDANAAVDAYAYAAYAANAAADAADAAAATYAAAKRKVRDSLIELFKSLLAVGQKVA